MKKTIFSLVCFLGLTISAYAQNAEPGVSGANYTQNTIEVGQITDLEISFSNSGTTPIPKGSIEMTISMPDNYYATAGAKPPSGSAGDLFDWEYIGMDVWRGTNAEAFPAFGGGLITLQVQGVNSSSAFEATTINIQAINHFAAFANSAANDNLAPELKINPIALVDTDADVVAPTNACVNLEVGIWLEGAFNGKAMNTKLNELHYLPGQKPTAFFGTATPAGQPYNTAPWNYAGTEGDAYDYRTSGGMNYPATTTDWVLVSLRKDTAASSTVWTQAGLLHSDGHIEFVSTSPCKPIDTKEDYFVVVEHRNHLIVMSHEQIFMTSETINYDFRTQQSYVGTGVLGTGQKQIDNQFVTVVGNGFQETANDVINIIATDKGKWLEENGDHSSYYLNDFDLNGDVNVHDKNLWLNNNGEFSQVPSGRGQK